MEFADNVPLEFLGDALARDVRASIETGIAAQAVFEDAGGPEELFRAAVRRAITAIESKDKEDLLPRFLSIGPYVDSGPIPQQDTHRYLSDQEVAAAVRFIFSSVINSFKGQLAEMLAVGPVVRLTHQLAAANPTETSIKVFAGDTVLAHPLKRKTWAKAADLHLLSSEFDSGHRVIGVHGVVEVKSFVASFERLQAQVQQHLTRARRGLRVQGEDVSPERIVMRGGSEGPAQVVVTSDSWELPRGFRFEMQDGRKLLFVDPPIPPTTEDRVERLSSHTWHVTLRWSEEALNDIAYAMTFAYMGALGCLLYEREGVPKEWAEMTPDEAGQNAVKMMLYYAILRGRTPNEMSRATALYNSYGFGYALGSSFVDRNGRREVLSYEDLMEILATGRSRTDPIDDTHPAQLCRIQGFRFG
jgi:hypothetical protein